VAAEKTNPGPLGQSQSVSNPMDGAVLGRRGACGWGSVAIRREEGPAHQAV